MQLFGDVLVALAVLIGTATALSVAILVAASATKPGQAPHGGIRRDLPQHPQPEANDARTLVLR